MKTQNLKPLSIIEISPEDLKKIMKNAKPKPDLDKEKAHKSKSDDDDLSAFSDSIYH